MRSCLVPVIVKTKAMAGFRTSRANFHTPITEPWHRATMAGWGGGEGREWGHKMNHFKDLEHSGSGAEREMALSDTRGQGNKPIIITGLPVTTG